VLDAIRLRSQGCYASVEGDRIVIRRNVGSNGISLAIATHALVFANFYERLA